MSEDEEVIHCDAFGCEETYPVHHPQEIEEGFRFGKWLGWVYLDINRPDIIDRPFRFHDALCLRWWIERETMTNRRWEKRELPPTPLIPKPSAVRRALMGHTDRRGGAA